MLGTILSAASAGAGLYDMFKGRQLNRSDFDYDPDRLAKKMYGDLINPTSSYNAEAFKRFQKIALASAPTMESMMEFARAGQLGAGTSAAIACVKAGVAQSKGMETASQAYGDFRINEIGQARGFLGMEYDRASAEMKGYTDYMANDEATQRSRGANMFALGATPLLKQLFASGEVVGNKAQEYFENAASEAKPPTPDFQPDITTELPSDIQNQIRKRQFALEGWVLGRER